VNELLFKQIQKAFKTELPPRPLLRPVPPPEAKRKPPPKDYAPPDAAAAQRRRRDLDEDLDFLPEFQELILIWHVTTEVFLLESNGQRSPEVDEGKYVEAINAVSNYMAFLAAVRSEMLPGLKLRSRHQATREALDSLWRSETGSRSTCTSLSSKTGDEKQRLVDILKRKESEKEPGEKRSALYRFGVVLSDGIQFANLLQELLTTIRSDQDWNKTLVGALQEGSNSWKRFMVLIPDLEQRPKRWNMLEMLKLLLKSWVRMRIYISIRCGRDSHAKQLGRGCELTTVVWILSEHATISIFALKPRDGR